MGGLGVSGSGRQTRQKWWEGEQLVFDRRRTGEKTAEQMSRRRWTRKWKVGQADERHNEIESLLKIASRLKEWGRTGLRYDLENMANDADEYPTYQDRDMER